MQHIFYKQRFTNVIAYFRRLEKMLKLFEIHSAASVENSRPIETKKEKVRKSSVNDPRPLKKNIPKHYNLAKTLMVEQRQE